MKCSQCGDLHSIFPALRDDSISLCGSIFPPTLIAKPKPTIFRWKINYDTLRVISTCVLFLIKTLSASKECPWKRSPMDKMTQSLWKAISAELTMIVAVFSELWNKGARLRQQIICFLFTETQAKKLNEDKIRPSSQEKIQTGLKLRLAWNSVQPAVKANSTCG